MELFDPETTSRRLSSTRSQEDSVRHTDALPPPGLPEDKSAHFQTHHAPHKLLTHPLLRRREPSQAEDDGEDVALLTDAQAPGAGQDEDITSMGHGQYGYDYSVDVTDGLPMASGRSYPNPRPFGATMTSTPEGIPLSFLGRHISDVQSSVPSRPFVSLGPPAGSSTSSVTVVAHTQNQSLTSTATAVPGGDTRLGPHTPIPLTTVFSRKAPALYLPRLDNYISSLPIPSYVASEQTKRTPTPNMFPPMQALANTKKTLVDLEHNATIPPSWRNCSGIFSTLLNLTIGITVCT